MIEAQYAMRCPGCDEPVEVGDKIGKLDGEWCCAACIEDADGEDGERCLRST